MSSRLSVAMRRLENSVNPAVNRYLFRITEAKAAKGEGWAPPFISCAQDAVGLTPTGPTAIRLGKPLPSYNVTTLYVLFLFQNTPTCHSYSSLCHLAYNITEKGSSQIFHSYSEICKCPDDIKCPTDWFDMSNSLVKAFKNAGNFNMLLESTH